MKVLFVTPPLHGENTGGIQVAARIAWQAVHANHDARLLEASAQARWAAVRAARALRFPADVVLVWHLDLLRLAPFIRSRGRRVVFLHGIEAWSRRGVITSFLLARSAIWSNSFYTIERARAHLHGAALDRAAIVALGIGTPLPTVPPPAATPIAIMIGRLESSEDYKGHREVLDAWPNTIARLPSAQLFIVGAGDLRAPLEDVAAELQIAHSVRFMGRVSESEKVQLLQAARCLVMPSRGEGFGLVYLEAMRMGRPCIVGTDAGREVVSPDTGVAVDPADQNTLTEALVALLSGGSRWAEQAGNARARYAANYTEAHFQSRLLDALERVS